MGKLEYYATEDVDMTGYELVLPAASIGSVGTLAIDLLLSNLPNRRIGHFFSMHFHAMFGCGALDATTPNYALELYLVEVENPFVVLQIRTGTTPGSGRNFCWKL